MCDIINIYDVLTFVYKNSYLTSEKSDIDLYEKKVNIYEDLNREHVDSFNAKVIF